MMKNPRLNLVVLKKKNLGTVSGTLWMSFFWKNTDLGLSVLLWLKASGARRLPD